MTDGPYCRNCGQPRDAGLHIPACDYMADMPNGCVCDPGGWDVNKVPPACERFTGKTGENCEMCEHDEACHKGSVIE